MRKAIITILLMISAQAAYADGYKQIFSDCQSAESGLAFIAAQRNNTIQTMNFKLFQAQEQTQYYNQRIDNAGDKITALPAKADVYETMRLEKDRQGAEYDRRGNEAQAAGKAAVAARYFSKRDKAYAARDRAKIQRDNCLAKKAVAESNLTIYSAKRDVFKSQADTIKTSLDTTISQYDSLLADVQLMRDRICQGSTTTH